MTKKSRKEVRKPDVVPSVRMACAKGRPIQLRYYCPIERREVRISTGTYDSEEAEDQKRKLEAKLLLGIPAKKQATVQTGPQMLWTDFRESYRTIQLTTINDESAAHAESRLDLAERIVSPRVLADIATPEAIHRLQAELLQGAESRFNRRRSPHTVKSYVTSVMAAVNWAHLQGWLESTPRIRKISVAKLKRMKGRPLTPEEFNKMLEVTRQVVGTEASESWKYVLRGLWESALRLDELMHVSWDNANSLRPVWQKDKLPVLVIPHSLQKNATEEEIPLLPGFEALLLQTPKEKRHGWVFEPLSLQIKEGHGNQCTRLQPDWVGKVISRIGKKAKIIVNPADETLGRPAKYASAHDLRRSCAEQMLNAGVPPLVIARVLRHASWETTKRHYISGDVQKDAKLLKDLLNEENET
jgi:integrase